MTGLGQLAVVVVQGKTFTEHTTSSRVLKMSSSNRRTSIPFGAVASTATRPSLEERLARLDLVGAAALLQPGAEEGGGGGGGGKGGGGGGEAETSFARGTPQRASSTVPFAPRGSTFSRLGAASVTNSSRFQV